MGASQSSPLIDGIKAALGGDEKLYAFPSKIGYQIEDVRPYNLTIPVKPAAVTYPKTAQEVAAIVKVAADNGLKVQPRGGGHSYANYCTFPFPRFNEYVLTNLGLGGVNGAVVIDLRHLQHFQMDRTTWRAKVGGGTLLGDLTKRMHDAGNRAMAHGTCPQVGIGGHATIGGLGPSSRLWGAALDHVEEVEVVLADSRIVRASAIQNQDIFWAIKGAGASFGIVTEFVVRTEPEPAECVHYSYSFTVGSWRTLASTFKTWQKFVSDPNLSRKFASELILSELGMIISGTYFGSEAEFNKLEMNKKFPGYKDHRTLVFKDWLGLVTHWGETVVLQAVGGLAAPLVAKSLTFNGADLIPDQAVDRLFAYLDRVEKGTLVWFIIFDLAGGAVNDIAQDATAYAHRDALFYLQSYAVGLGKVKTTTRRFLAGVNTTIRNGMPGGQDFGAYPGYVDPTLVNGPLEYWRTNLPRLQQIKSVVDPRDIFHNPQSVPLAGTPAPRSAPKTARVRVSVHKLLAKFCFS
jgi:hypothetical protein